MKKCKHQSDGYCIRAEKNYCPSDVCLGCDHHLTSIKVLEAFDVYEKTSIKCVLCGQFLTRPNPTFNSDGDRFYFDNNGELHSYNDLPAIERTNGTLEWFRHGIRHIDGGKPAIVRTHFGRQFVYIENGKLIKEQ